MFGISTFAQSPFAALGGNAYPLHNTLLPYKINALGDTHVCPV